MAHSAPQLPAGLRAALCCQEQSDAGAEKGAEENPCNESGAGAGVHPLTDFRRGLGLNELLTRHYGSVFLLPEGSRE
jgi:hypothetical protein